MIAPKDAGFAFGSVGRVLPKGNWITQTESLGKRTIDGIEYEGTRETRVSTDPPATATYESWRSKELDITALAEASGPGWKHSAKLQKLNRREPDAALFVIPSDYTIQEMDSAAPPQH